MSNFHINPRFVQELQNCIEDWVDAIAQANDDVISIPRYWEGWQTGNPFRDIIDTEALRNSKTKLKVSNYDYTVTWSVPYIGYVYNGFTLQDGRKIPARKWCEVAERENDYKGVFVKLLKQRKLIS
jgi:hypothetical protein